MTSAIRLLSLAYMAVTALFLTYLGTIWSFFPSEHMAKLGVTATELTGINTLKSIMGMGLLGFAGCCVMFLFNQQNWYRPLYLLTAILLIVRVMSLFTDGYHPRMALYAVLEVLILVAVFAAVKTGANSKEPNR